MRIIALNRFYKPDHSATSQLLTDLAEHLVREGHAVTILTSRLRYEGDGLLPAREMLAGVEVRRIWTTQFGRARLVGRAIDYATFYVSAFFSLLGAGRRGDVVIAKTDPPLISVVAALAASLKGMKLVNWCQDLFPEVAGALGMGWAKGWAGNLLRGMRNWSLNRAKVNAVLHEVMAERLRREGIAPDTIRILPNWADAGIQPIAHADNELRAGWGLNDRFVIAYSGNLGRAHMPDIIARLIKDTLAIDGLTWLMVGGGAGMAGVRAAVGDAPNVVFKPYQPLSALSDSLSAGDAHLIALHPDCEGYIVPSKYYGVRAVDRPVIFLGDADGAVAREIAGEGLVLDPARPDAWKDQVEAFVRRCRVSDESGRRRPIPDALKAWTTHLALAAQAERGEKPATHSEKVQHNV